MHGKIERASAPTSAACYAGLPKQFDVVRYHSLVIERETLPAVLDVTATSRGRRDHGRAPSRARGTPTPLEGVQFHPESILTEHGHAMLRNFLQLH